ncbi:uncharacterized protein Z518_02463 [Rhinocladiella mackenziei CBS 650.93]|uniref:Uncharacterized protein n=1 Tax=Rhinocladiella mackenziei CBS 650.93 TaxID=1442369 RepID=A0A0D2IPJ1_9EURO|nr:uncharacterized protein Z518_02463 [Rhinocladiella mackenziei CBS 650.93]KIX07809.1 hypothetical protein Z518_02463 [Rhinocladiella mackenziei CBS 650.93]
MSNSQIRWSHRTSTGRSTTFQICVEYLKVFTRSLRLHIIWQLTPKSFKAEQPKVAVYHDHKASILRSAVHLIPLGGALALHGHPICRQDLGDLMQGSLATTFLGVIRHELLSSRSLPLGSFFRPLQATGISFLWSIDLWGTLTGKWLGKRRKIVLFLVTYVMVILAAVVGPSGAVLMIPRLITTTDAKYLVFFDNATALLPQRIGLSNTLHGA